jgi:hypothetical protein
MADSQEDKGFFTLSFLIEKMRLGPLLELDLVSVIPTNSKGLIQHSFGLHGLIFASMVKES